MPTSAQFRGWVRKFTPRPLLQLIKRQYYPFKLRRMDLEAYEPDLRVVKQLVFLGATAVDIGANIGLYTVALSRLVGPGGRVLSIEPVPATCRLLRSNVRRLGLRNVQVAQAAVSDRESGGVMQVPRYADGGENYYEAALVAAAAPGMRAVSVQRRTLDSMVRETGLAPDFIKCDVEGHELAVLEGAAELLARGRPAWLMECNSDPDEPGSAAERLFARMRARDYEAYWFDGERLRPRDAGDRSVNYFFLTLEHQKRLRALPSGLLR